MTLIDLRYSIRLRVTGTVDIFMYLYIDFLLFLHNFLFFNFMLYKVYIFYLNISMPLYFCNINPLLTNHKHLSFVHNLFSYKYARSQRCKNVKVLDNIVSVGTDYSTRNKKS